MRKAMKGKKEKFKLFKILGIKMFFSYTQQVNQTKSREKNEFLFTDIRIEQINKKGGRDEGPETKTDRPVI